MVVISDAEKEREIWRRFNESRKKMSCRGKSLSLKIKRFDSNFLEAL